MSLLHTPRERRSLISYVAKATYTRLNSVYRLYYSRQIIRWHSASQCGSHREPMIILAVGQDEALLVSRAAVLCKTNAEVMRAGPTDALGLLQQKRFDLV